MLWGRKVTWPDRYHYISGHYIIYSLAVSIQANTSSIRAMWAVWEEFPTQTWLCAVYVGIVQYIDHRSQMRYTLYIFCLLIKFACWCGEKKLEPSRYPEFSYLLNRRMPDNSPATKSSTPCWHLPAEPTRTRILPLVPRYLHLCPSRNLWTPEINIRVFDFFFHPPSFSSYLSPEYPLYNLCNIYPFHSSIHKSYLVLSNPSPLQTKWLLLVSPPRKAHASAAERRKTRKWLVC